MQVRVDGASSAGEAPSPHNREAADEVAVRGPPAALDSFPVVGDSRHKKTGKRTAD